MKLRTALVLASSLPVIAAIPNVAVAQAAAGATPAGRDDTGASEIIVTANKREQRLNDVGLTITALGGDVLKERKIDSLADIAQAVPGLSYTTSANNTPVFTLRGIGFYETSFAAYPTTSVYVDEVPLPFPVMTNRIAFDLARVEVLKGPQGTLFGNNATGGAINYIAAKPTNTFKAGGDLTYGRFNEVTGEGFVSGPITDNLLARVAVRASHADDYQLSYTRNDSNGKTEYYAGRVLLDWRATDALRFRLNVNGWQDKSDPIAPQFLEATPQQAEFDPRLATYPRAPSNDRAADWDANSPPRGNNKMFQASLRSDYNITESIALTSITAYEHYKNDQTLEQDGTDLNVAGDVLLGTINSFSQELRLSNGAARGFRWVVGGNYSSDDADETDIYSFSDSSAATTLGIKGAVFESQQEMKNYAAFGNAEFDIKPNLTAKGGVRYTEADRNGSFCSSDPNTGTTNAFFTELSSELTGTSVPAVGPNECFVLGQNLLPSRTPTKLTLDENNVSWRVGLDWKVRHGSLLYANISKGFKAGSFPTLSASSVTQYRAVTQESVLAYEAGFKLALLGRRVSLNGAAFYYDYKNKQLLSKLVDPVFGLLNVLTNIPKSSVKGAELELAVQPTHELSMYGSAVYTDATVNQFTGVNGVGEVANYQGAAVPFTPKWRFAAGGEYKMPLTDTLGGFVGTDYSRQSSAVTIIGGGGLNYIKPYGLLDLRAGVETKDGRWRAQIWGKNVLNTYYWSNALTLNDTFYRYAGRPATYGLTISHQM